MERKHHAKKEGKATCKEGNQCGVQAGKPNYVRV
jgi:hypothetical protein